MDIAIRLALTVIAAGTVGINRGVSGHAAGLRTTILVALAACVAMIQTNILLSVDGKTAASFATMDVMRLPLGILTGVGFIGGGVIFRRGDLVTGVTTAATLWAVTVIGLCFGGGQITLGVAAAILTILTLWALAWLETFFPRAHYASLVVEGEFDDVLRQDLQKRVGPLGYEVRFRKSAASENGNTTAYDLRWTAAGGKDTLIDLFALLERHYRIISLERRDEAMR